MHEDDIAQREFVNDPVRMKRQADWERRYLQRPLLKAALIVAGVLLSGCMEAPKGDSLVINFDDGGSLRSFSESSKRVDSVEIRGACLSACAMYLTSKNVCVDPKAEIGFHGSWPRLDSDRDQYRRDEWFASHFPVELRQDFMDDWRHHGPWTLHTMTGAELLARVPSITECK